MLLFRKVVRAVIPGTRHIENRDPAGHTDYQTIFLKIQCNSFTVGVERRSLNLDNNGIITFKRAGVLHQDFLKIDFLVVSDRGE